MRKFILLGILLASVNSFASHIFGGNITWKCLGNNQYIFKIDLYKDCSPNTTWLRDTVSLRSTALPGQKIYADRDTILDMSLKCNGPNSLGCNQPIPSGVDLYRYFTDTITLPGPPPTQGWLFSYSICCKSGATVNIQNGTRPLGITFIRSTMYSSNSGCESSPYFDFNPAQQIITTTNSLSTLGSTSNPADSLYYDFSPPHYDASNPSVFLPGFNMTNPFPNPTSNALNGPITINHFNGLIDFDIQQGTPGYYYYAVSIEQWRNNQLLSEIVVDNSVLGDFSQVSNNAPAAVVDTSIYNLIRNGDVYQIEAVAGDTIEFVIQASDSDIDTSTNQNQMIEFSAFGFALDSSWNNGNSYSTDANLNPVAPQTGFSNPVSNKVKFFWVPGVEHYQGAQSSHPFHFQFKDDNCPYVGLTNIIVEVNIKNVAYAKADTVNVCQGDSVEIVGLTASGQYQWSPALNISSNSVQNPKVAPSTSQYYYIEDPVHPGIKDSVFVNVTPSGSFDLAMANGKLTLNDSAQTTSRTWFYNSVPFSYAYDTLTPFGLGDYYVEGSRDVCQYTSNTVSIVSGMNLSVSSPGNGSHNGNPELVTGSLGVSFTMSNTVSIHAIYIPGIHDINGKTGGYDLKVQLFEMDSASSVIFNTDITLARPIDNVLRIPVKFTLNNNSKYRLAISGDTGYTFSLLENVVVPTTPFNQGLTITSLREGSHGQRPMNHTQKMIPFSLGVVNTIGVNDVRIPEWSIYPNPSKDQIQITGLDGVSLVELTDVNGKVVRSLALDKDQAEVIINRGDLASGLYIIKVQLENGFSVKKVLFQ